MKNYAIILASGTGSRSGLNIPKQFFKIKNKFVDFGSQDVSGEISTKATGNISPIMLKEFNVNYSIVGHSERRAKGETDALVAEKVECCVKNNICPIICVGEKTKNSSLSTIKKQVEAAVGKIEKSSKIIFAYEPVWAIGSGEIPTVAKINKALSIIKKSAKKCGVDSKILYGGSVNLQNYKELLKSNADGFLLGGISLKTDEFIELACAEKPVVFLRSKKYNFFEKLTDKLSKKFNGDLDE